MKLFSDKKGQVFDQLSALAIGIATVAIVLVVGFLILAQAEEQIVTLDAENSTAYNSTGTLTNALADIPPWIPLVVIASIGAILLGLVALFRGRR